MIADGCDRDRTRFAVGLVANQFACLMSWLPTKLLQVEPKESTPVLNVSFSVKNYATGCPFLTKIMVQSITDDKILCGRISRRKKTF